jgi:hypothetical protein
MSQKTRRAGGTRSRGDAGGSKGRGRRAGASVYAQPVERFFDMFLDELVKDDGTWLSVLSSDDAAAVFKSTIAPSFTEECASVTDPDKRVRRRSELRTRWADNARDSGAKAVKRFRGVSADSRGKTLRGYWHGRRGQIRTTDGKVVSRPAASLVPKLLAKRLRPDLDRLRDDAEWCGLIDRNLCLD